MYLKIKATSIFVGGEDENEVPYPEVYSGARSREEERFCHFLCYFCGLLKREMGSGQGHEGTRSDHKNVNKKEVRNRNV